MRIRRIVIGLVVLASPVGCYDLSGFGSVGGRCPPELHTLDCIGSWDSTTCTCTPQRPSTSERPRIDAERDAEIDAAADVAADAEPDADTDGASEAATDAGAD